MMKLQSNIKDYQIETCRNNILIKGYDGKATKVENLIKANTFRLKFNSKIIELHEIVFLIIDTIDNKEEEIIISNRLLKEQLSFDIIEHIEKHLKNPLTKVNQDNEKLREERNKYEHEIYIKKLNFAHEYDTDWSIQDYENLIEEELEVSELNNIKCHKCVAKQPG